MNQNPGSRLSAIVALAAVGVFALGFPVRYGLVRWGIIDRPNQRSSHSEATARGGGIAILSILILIGSIAGMQPEDRGIVITLLAVAAFLAAISFVDDLWSLPAGVRFGCHGLAALSALAVLGWPQFGLGLIIPTTANLFLCSSLAFLWIAGYTNAFNFMDGINGIAGGQAVVTGLGTALLGGLSLGVFTSAPVQLSLILAGAALGFLPHNFPRARMFMGDVGSAPLGFLLAALVLWLAKVAGWWLLIPLVLLHANFVLDTAITLARRILRGECWYKAHREHFYQRLIRGGKSHAFVTGWEMALQCLVLGLMVTYVRLGTGGRWILGLAVIGIWLTFFAYCEMVFKRKAAR